MAIGTFTLTGNLTTYANLERAAGYGSLIIRAIPDSMPVPTELETLVQPDPFPIASDGTFSIELDAVAGVRYRVSTSPRSLFPSFAFDALAAGETRDLSELQTVPATSPTVPYLIGPAGATAYEIAVANGFVGTEAEWLASLGGTGGVSSWNDLTDKPTTFPPATHNHDDRYYTEAEVDALVSAAGPKPWQGKTIATFGDSITWYDGHTFNPSHVESGQNVVGYQSYMRSALGVTVTNLGIDGAQMPAIRTAIRGAALSTFDAITITAGANDFRNSPGSLGAIAAIGSTFNTLTFYGAMQDAIEYALSVKPTLKIFLLCPIKGWSSSSIMPETYPQAFIDVGNLYSLPVCDWYHTSGISLPTRSALIGDVAVSYYLHPTNAGFKRMADILVPFLANRATPNITTLVVGPDTVAPDVPATLTATAITTTTVDLAWSTSTDNVGVTGYEYRIGTGAAVSAGTGNAVTVTGLTASTTYAFQIRAFDAAGNRSAWSTAANATTPAVADTTPPTVGTLTSSAIGENGFTLTVTGASDAVALNATPYRFSTDNGATYSAYQSSAVYVASGLTAATAYTCKHQTRDAAGNVSTGAAITVTTAAHVWSPTDLGGSLFAWYDPSDAATITATGSSVTAFNDKSGNARHVSQATSTRQPATGTRTIGGLNALDYDGGDVLSYAVDVPISQPYTVVMVVKADVTTERVALSYSSTYAGYVYTGKWAMNGGSIFASTTAVDTTGAHLLTTVFNGATSTIRLDATQIASGSAGTTAPLRINLGANNTTATAGWDGMVGECVIVTGALTGTNLTNLEGYLKAKWGTP